MSSANRPISDVASATAAVQSFPAFSKTLELILAQRGNNQGYIPYYVFKDEVQSLNLGGVNISIKYDDPGPNYYPSIAQGFADITLATGIAFKEVSSKSGSLFDLGRLEDHYSRINYYGQNASNTLGLSFALGNELGQLWRLQTWKESEYGDVTKNILDTQATIRHEMGHALGLSHPDPEGGGVDGYNKAFNQLDTVMSYNLTDPPNPLYTQADINALKSILSTVQANPVVAPGVAIQKDNINVYEFDDLKQEFVWPVRSSSSTFARAAARAAARTQQSESWQILPPKRSAFGMGSLFPWSQPLAAEGPAVDDWNPVDEVTGLRIDSDLLASSGADYLIGSTQGDVIASGDGSDWVSSGLGNDVIDAGLGLNRIRTGPGQDVVVIRNRDDLAGFDAVHDFSDQDRVRLIGFDPEALSITTFGQQSVLSYNEDIIGVFNHPITFAAHVQVVV